MAPMKKCSTTKAHCRKVGSKQKAKLPCTVNGARGTVVKRHSRPKSVCARNKSASKIQALVRRKQAARKKSSRKRPASPLRVSSRPKKSTKRLISSM